MSQTESAPQGSVPQVQVTPINAPVPVGNSTEPHQMRPRDVLTRRLYFRGLGLVYLIAFLSLWSQIHGLIGQQGLLPAERFFKAAREQLGAGAFHQLPSLCWLGSNDLMLHGWCALGTLLSLALMIGMAPRLVLVLLWVIYLSLGVAGQAFLSFQWDTLMLEMTACSLLYAPRGWRPNWQNPPDPLPLARWLLWGLAFKLMFLSGVTKLLSGDPAWNDGTALQFHYYTQPIPTWTSWYAYQAPLAVHQLSLLVMFIVEALMPFLIFAGRWGRIVFGLAKILLMVAIEATGNFGFFNLQTIVLCVPLLNDDLLRRLIPRRWRPLESPLKSLVARSQWRSITGITLAATMLLVSTLTMAHEMVRTQQADKMPRVVVFALGLADRAMLSWGDPHVLKPLAPLRTINGYGLFRVMTTHRPEIIVEISNDGVTWEACEFPYKPGNVDRAPPLVAPHMPRLDWQMWFAALNPRGNGYWLDALTQRILQGNPTTARLLGHPELANNPPRFVRLSYYEYKFSSAEQRRATGAWWSRSHAGYLTGVLSLRTE